MLSAARRARLGWALRALASHWRRRPLQLGALLLGLACATALWSGVQALNAQAKTSYARAAEAFSGGGLDMLVAAEGGPVAEGVFGALRRAGWRVSPVVEGRVALGGTRVRLMGLDPISLPAEAGLALFGASGQARGGAGLEDGPGIGPGIGLGGGFDFAAFAAPPGRTLIAPETLADLGLAEGDRPETPRGALPPLTASAALSPGLLVTDVGLAQGLLGLEGRLSRLMAAAPRPGASPAPLAEAAPGLRRERAAPEADLGQLTESFHLNLTAFGLLSFAVGLFIVHGAIGLAFEQRKPLMRTLRAVGLSAQDLTLALLAELLALALLAGAAGVALGYVIAGALLPDVALSLRGLYGAQVPGALSLSPWWWAAGLAMSLLGAGAASAAALARAARLPVLASAQPEAWLAEERRRLRLQGGAAASLGAAALGLTLFGQGLVAGFALMGALLIGAALALPPVLAAGLAWASGRRSAARRPLLHWALADARQGLPGLSLALMALLMALAVNIGVGAMVDGFRLTFTVWLEDRLAADAYVRAQAGREAELEDWMQARAEVLAILPEISAETALGGWPVELRGFSADPLYAARWPLLEAASEVWDRVGYGEAALVSEQLARREGLALGDVVELSAPAGPWPLQVAGIYADYGNPRGQIRVALSAMSARWPGAEGGGYGVRLTPGAVQDFLGALNSSGGPPVAQSIDQAALRRLSASVFERTFAVTAALNALTFAVAGLALLTALATLSEARLPQLAPLWAMGAGRRRLAALELGKTLGLALATAVLAVPLGVALAWALVAVINVEAFGWRLPLHLFPEHWARLGALALMASALAAAAPLARLAKAPPARLAATFSAER